MSYCIEYNPELKGKYPKVKIQRHIPTKKILYLLMFFVGTYLFVQSKAYRFLLPGDPDITISAFSTLVERVGDGTPVKDAVMGFCEEIILDGMK